MFNDVLNCLESTPVTFMCTCPYAASFMSHIPTDVHGTDSIVVHSTNILTCPTMTFSHRTMCGIVKFISIS